MDVMNRWKTSLCKPQTEPKTGKKTGEEGRMKGGSYVGIGTLVSISVATLIKLNLPQVTQDVV